MGIYIDKFFLFLAGTWLLYNNVVIPVDVAYLLSGVIILLVSFYFDTVKNITAMNIVYISEIIAGLFFPKTICFFTGNDIYHNIQCKGYKKTYNIWNNIYHACNEICIWRLSGQQPSYNVCSGLFHLCNTRG